MSGTLFRGQAIRRRADIQRTQIIQEPRTFLGRLTSVLLDRTVWALRWGTWGAVMTVWGLIYVPPAGLLALVALPAVVIGGSWALAVTGAIGGAGAWAWSRHSPRTWTRWVSSRAHRFWRRIRYRATWDDVLAASGVKATDAAHRIVVPRLLWVHLSAHTDQLTVQLCPGVTVATIAEQVEALASEWCALEVRVTRHPRAAGWAVIRVVLADLLAEEHEPERDRVDLARLTLGRREDGRLWTLRLFGRHLLVAGCSGAGKGSIVTSLLWALAPAIRDGWVRVIGIDPKGGMEFGMYAGLFHMLADQNEAELVAALEAAAAQVEARCQALKGRTRLHRPTVDEPFYVVIIDEIASLTAYITDRALRDRADGALGRLLTKGRAPGFSVVGCVQDPRKEVLKLRNLFTVKIGLRLDSPSEVAMVLGDEAHDRGARCEEVSDLTPGIGYVVDDEARGVVKVRADYHPDPELAWLAAEYASPTREDVPELVIKDRNKPRRDAS